MPTSTYTPLANITLGSSAASVTFSSISQAYRDLVLVVRPIAASSGDNIHYRVNSSTSGYSWITAYGDGSSTGSGAVGSDDSFRFRWAYLSTSPTNFVTSFMDYSATDKHKTILGRGDSSGYASEMIAARWANTSAITSIYIYQENGTNFASGTTMALYGIAA